MLLALDTSTRQVGVALFDSNTVLSEMSWFSQDHHTVELAPMVAQSFARVGASPSDLAAIGVATGPGSFTGLRIGLALGKGLALVHHLPLLGVPTLDVLVAAQPLAPEPLVALIAAGRRRLALGWYAVVEDRWQLQGEWLNQTPVELLASLDRPVRVCGELNADLRAALAETPAIAAPPSRCLRRPGVLAELAWQRWQAGQATDPASLAPVYLHHGDPIPA